MSGRTRHGWARAAVCATALAAPLAISGCASSATSTARPGATIPGTAPRRRTERHRRGRRPAGAVPAPATAPLNATGGTKLTVGDGTSKVLLDGHSVDFGTEVHDLAWSPDGRHAAFIDGTGSLSVADADGSGRVEVRQEPRRADLVAPDVAGHRRAADVSRTRPWHRGLRVLRVQRGRRDAGVRLRHRARRHAQGAAAGPRRRRQTPRRTPRPATAGRTPAARPAARSTSTTTAPRAGLHPRRLPAPAGRQDLRRRGRAGVLRHLGARRHRARAQAGVVFVRVVDGHKHVFLAVQPATGAWKPVDLTPDAAFDCTAPAISPDAKHGRLLHAVGGRDGQRRRQRAEKITDRPGTPAFR